MQLSLDFLQKILLQQGTQNVIIAQYCEKHWTKNEETWCIVQPRPLNPWVTSVTFYNFSDFIILMLKIKGLKELLSIL